jgi:hypothetical protein
MTADRRIDLNLSLPQSGSRDLQAGLGSPGRDAARGDADAEARERFEQALAGKQAAADATPATTLAPTPFALFGTPAPVQADAVPTALGRHVEDAVERLMVDEDRAGQRQVRMELKDDVLPGVSVVILENEGRLQVDFICSQESSRLRLNRAAPQQAQTLAERLAREVLLRVMTDDDEDPCLFEVAASP